MRTIVDLPDEQITALDAYSKKYGVWRIEFNLRRHPDFQKNFRLEEKIRSLGSGLFHKNYLFEASGKYLVLRLGIVEPLSFLTMSRAPAEPLKIIAEIATEVHALAKSEFAHLDQHADSQGHVIASLKALPKSLFEEFPEAANARDWILSQLPRDRASTVLHGDLLPQNLLFEIRENGEIAVVDWECAQIGDPAYDLAIVTRGVRKPLGIPGGLQRLVQFYNEAAEHKISANAVVVHEVLLHLNWLAEAAEASSRNQLEGHGPEHYATFIGGILRRARAGQ